MGLAERRKIKELQETTFPERTAELTEISGGGAITYEVDWDSFADDAFCYDADRGIYFDPDRMRSLNHEGEHFSVSGPLNIARPVQGWPVIFQAGASEPGRQLAGETAEAVFAAESSLEGSKAYYADVKQRAVKAGRICGNRKAWP